MASSFTKLSLASARSAERVSRAQERAQLQTKINRLNSEREKFVAQRMKEVAGTNTLDSVVISAIREQGRKRNLQFQ